MQKKDRTLEDLKDEVEELKRLVKDLVQKRINKVKLNNIWNSFENGKCCIQSTNISRF